jgi:hypothetical protein
MFLIIRSLTLISNIVIDQESKISDSTSDSGGSTNPEQEATEKGSAHGLPKKITVEDALCCLCNELLYLPSVLNCGHGECYMYCLFSLNFCKTHLQLFNMAI